MSIAIYSRKSCLTDKGESTKNQINMCKQYIYTHICPSEKCKLIIYKDEGFSAKNTDRPELKKMISDAETGVFSHIVCYKLDRISRNVSDFSKLIEKFNNLNISFICIKEQFDTSVPMGRAMMYMASVFSQLERETIAERVRDNMLMLSKSGRWLGGPPPLGFESYKVFNSQTKKYEFHLKTNSNDIKTAKKIFSKFLETQSLSKTKKYLDKIGLKSKSGKLFSIPSIKKILTNPIYCSADSEAKNYFKKLGAEICFENSECNKSRGIITYNKRNYCKNHGTKNPISDWIISIGEHEGIITGKNWIKTNNILCGDKRKKTTNNYSLLSGKIICEKCGSKMISKLRSKSGTFDYICSNKIYHGAKKCSCRNLNGENTDKLIVEKLISNIIENPDKLKISERTNIQKITNHFKQANINNIINSIPLNIKKVLADELINSIYWNGSTLNISFKN